MKRNVEGLRACAEPLPNGLVARDKPSEAGRYLRLNTLGWFHHFNMSPAVFILGANVGGGMVLKIDFGKLGEVFEILKS